jgi:hypothetical protein
MGGCRGLNRRNDLNWTAARWQLVLRVEIAGLETGAPNQFVIILLVYVLNLGGVNLEIVIVIQGGVFPRNVSWTVQVTSLVLLT